MAENNYSMLHFQRTLVMPFVRKYVKVRQRHFTVDTSSGSQLPVDIVIPLSPKDLPVLPRCIEGLRRNLMHPVKAFRIVAPRDEGILEACQEHGCEFVDERDILPEGPEHYREIFKNTRLRRGNWMYQQFLKLSVGQKLGLEYFLVYDSDTVLIKPFKYEFDGRVVLEFTDGYKEELDPLHEKLIPRVRLQPYSFMCHAMLMNTGVIAGMLASIEETTGKEWKEGIIEAIDMSLDLCFSEYELYGNYSAKGNAGNGKPPLMVYWFNKALKRRDIDDFDRWVEAYSGRYRTLSFHSYAR